MSRVFKRLISSLNHSFVNCRVASWRHLLLEASSLPQLLIPLNITRPDNEIMIGDGAKNYIKEKKPSSSTLTIFFNSVREYYVTLLDYLKGPLRQRVGIKCLKEAAVADTTRQEIASFTSVEFFINKYPQLLRNIGCKSQDLEREFNLYKGYEFPLFITQDSTVKTGTVFKKPECERQDRRWAWIGKLTDPATGEQLFKYLHMFMINILCIPVSQASAERQFSMIRKNYKQDRANMSLKTFNAIMQVKTQ